MSLKSLLPKPTHFASKWETSDAPLTKPVYTHKNTVPAYLHRRSFIPTLAEHFGDGGSFPEINVVQYPLGLGRAQVETIKTLPLQMDIHGNERRDLILHQDHILRANKTVHSDLIAMTEKDIAEAELERPDAEAVALRTQETKEKLDALVNGRTITGRTKHIESLNQTSKAEFVRYTSATGDESGPSTRIIKMANAPQDPMEPPRFKHRKVPRGPPSPPPPVLQSPPRKVSLEEQKNWVIPPCISNWKNAKGYTIPLDKRLANDGRGLQDVSINDNFAKVSEALFIADKHAREQVKLRAEMMSMMAQKEKREKEEKLMQLAQQARMERTGVPAASAPRLQEASEPSSGSEDESLTVEEQERLKERQALRKQMQRERETRKPDLKKYILNNLEIEIYQKKLRLESQSLLHRKRACMISGYSTSRRVSLLALVVKTHTLSTINRYSSRRQRQYTSQHGPHLQILQVILLYTGYEADKIAKLLSDSGPHKGFKGAEHDSGAPIRDGPVQFEKEQDVFGMDAFMNAAKRGRDQDNSQNKRQK